MSLFGLYSVLSKLQKTKKNTHTHNQCSLQKWDNAEVQTERPNLIDQSTQSSPCSSPPSKKTRDVGVQCGIWTMPSIPAASAAGPLFSSSPIAAVAPSKTTALELRPSQFHNMPIKISEIRSKFSSQLFLLEISKMCLIISQMKAQRVIIALTRRT